MKEVEGLIKTQQGTLNKAQLEAVESDARSISIIAGPGTGKTKTLVAKINYLISKENVEPSSILVLTFTRKAAKEIQARVQTELESTNVNMTENKVKSKTKTKTKSVKSLFVGTFHSFGLEILKQSYNEECREINLITEPDRLNVIKKIAQDAWVKSAFKQQALKELSLLISNYKNKIGLISLQGQQKEDNDLKELVYLYNQALVGKKLFDFDDLIAKAFEILKSDTEIKEKLQKQFKYILIDEFQDTNELQYALIKKLITSSTHLFVIGDPLQSIYAFRGAKGDIFDILAMDFPDTKKITLNINYRSRQEIIEVSHQLFNSSPKLVSHIANDTDLGHPNPVQVITTMNEYSEARWIVNKLSEIMGGLDLNQIDNLANTNKENTFSDFAIIYRTHGTARVLEEKFRESGIPYQKVGDEPFFLRPEIIEIVAALKELHQANMAAVRTNKKLSSIIHEIIDAKDINSRLETKQNRLLDLQSFINELIRFEKYSDPVEAFLTYFEELSAHDYYDEKSDKVTFLTMHAAKGLEFKYVFICGFEDGLVPYTKRSDTDETLAEERRLLYVAMTRAKSVLYLLSAKERTQQGKRSYQKISRFSMLLKDAGDENIMFIQDTQIEKIRKWRNIQKAKKSQIKMF